MEDMTNQCESQVEEYLRQLSNALDNSTQAMDELEVRLVPVLRQPEPTPLDDTKHEPEPELVPVAERIRQSVLRVETLTQRKNYLMRRLEI